MKDFASYMFYVGLMFLVHVLLDTKPAVETWWTYIILGATLWAIGDWRERKAIRKRLKDFEERYQKRKS